jgi:toxin ParE1/3/4
VAEYSLSNQAADDLDQIFRYTIETFGLAQAERYYRTLVECLERAARQPRRGRAIAGRGRVFYQHNCRRHGIFYSIGDRGIFVARVLHLAMEFRKHLPA